MIKITSLNKIYKSKKRKKCHALNDISLTLPDAGLVFVLGKSGSGKSTLLNLIGGLDSVTSGSIEVDGNNLAKFREKDFCNYRNSHIGFIFQDYHLIDELTVYENIRLSLDLENRSEDHLIGEALARVDLAGYEERYPTELSGGEQQRVAIARAIVKKPRIILADEPTGNLDTHTARAIVDLLKGLSRECLILIVSHNVNDANNYADRIIELKKGEIISDKSRNPEFLDEVTLKDDNLVYPDGLTLSDKDIEFINENTSKRFVIKKDKFLPTVAPQNEAKEVKIENKKLKFSREMSLSGKFLKNKAIAISLSSFMVAVIMVIMALAQTIIAFDGGGIVAEEMTKANQQSLLLNKILDSDAASRLDMDYRVEIDENDIQALYDAGYKGKIYPVFNTTVPVSSDRNSLGFSGSYFSNSAYISETLGTVVVDEEFLVKKYGQVEYVARLENEDPYGLIITDYIADGILMFSNTYRGKTYEDLLGEYYPCGWSYDNIKINGIINTHYKEKHADLFEKIQGGGYIDYASLIEDEKFIKFTNDVYDNLGYSYSINPDYAEYGYLNRDWFSHGKLVINDVIEFSDTKSPYFSLLEKSDRPVAYLKEGEISMNITEYNEIFGTSYNASNLHEFTPHTMKITMYRWYDVDNKNPVYSIEIVVNSLHSFSDTLLMIRDKNENWQNELIKINNNYAYALYLDGTEGIGTVLDAAERLNYEPQSIVVEGIHTMTKAVDVFIPIFELIAIFLCIGVVFILVNFSSKMINDKMHEIGILKALGTKNSSIGAIFGLQVMLIAVFTCILATAGYYFFIDLANDILIESLIRLAPSRVILDLNFLIFKPQIAVENCFLVVALAFISLIMPFMKIKFIEPVKIIKRKE